MTDRTLVIIDMQYIFVKTLRDKDNLIPTICRLVQYARQRKWAIILVEFSQCGTTNVKIINALKGYPYQAKVVKECNDGGREIIKCIIREKTWSFDLLVCGVYGPECVAETVAGLLNHSDLVEVDIITDAVCPAYRSLSEENEYDGRQREFEVVMEDVCVDVYGEEELFFRNE